ncbi:MAG: NAD(P)H-dependent oxidoreductase [Candidatus Pacebacteria bacterium]|nr:NAD(P)H-dependent oxidoreductase [Candidatus Paceibacterota bacterium]
MKKEEIIEALNKRYAVKTFDKSKKVSEEDLKTILESGRLAPSSLGLEPWKFIVVKNEELRAKMRAASYDQTKVTDASYLIVVAYRTDSEKLVSEILERTAKIQNRTKEELAPLQQMLDGAMSRQEPGKTSWIKAQGYIALGMMIETASLLNVDNCPMEGFDPAQIDTILGLKEKNLSTATILAIGYRGLDAYASKPKVRRSYDEVVEVVD